ncbi:hypothetical protein CO112_02415 [Candidatus Dojkabacteria bacterium CG_4_9_14_3_um_filter_150_Dojkabacteria_WS6_41_13]|nr:MAG: hypothetical protein CO112_02415 [Candidatus Dojkabacteria bacterium CG_4_9_14_3_um_filter_150_Dojkabacteria_WS6_41_13]
MKKAIVVILVVAGLVLLGLFLGGFLGNSQEKAESERKQANPIFHTVKEGGVCRDAQGDCEGGLTCVAGVCAKP